MFGGPIENVTVTIFNSLIITMTIVIVFRMLILRVVMMLIRKPGEGDFVYFGSVSNLINKYVL